MKYIIVSDYDIVLTPSFRERVILFLRCVVPKVKWGQTRMEKLADMEFLGEYPGKDL